MYTTAHRREERPSSSARAHHARTTCGRQAEAAVESGGATGFLPSFLANLARLSVGRLTAEEREERQWRRRSSSPSVRTSVRPSVRRSITPTCELRKSALSLPLSLSPAVPARRTIQRLNAQCTECRVRMQPAAGAGAAPHLIVYGLPLFLPSFLPLRPSHSKDELCPKVEIGHPTKSHQNLGPVKL